MALKQPKPTIETQINIENCRAATRPKAWNHTVKCSAAVLIEFQQEYIEDLVNLLFCMDSERFASTITKKPYPKYQFQSHQVERKLDSKTINRV